LVVVLILPRLPPGVSGRSVIWITVLTVFEIPPIPLSWKTVKTVKSPLSSAYIPRLKPGEDERRGFDT
jgi:hypothetical protein